MSALFSGYRYNTLYTISTVFAGYKYVMHVTAKNTLYTMSILFTGYKYVMPVTATIHYIQ